MPRSYWKKVLRGAALATLLTFGGGLLPPPAHAFFFGGVTLKDEKEMGRKFDVMVRSRMPVIEDPEVSLYVDGIVQRLVRAIPPQPFTFTSGTVLYNALNAFAVPGGYVYVFSGLIMNLNSEEELAGVMAHELSHVKNRDILVMSVASLMASLVAYVTRIAVWSTMFSDERNGASMLLVLLADITLPIAAMLVQLGVSRNREYLADETGARMTGKPMALASALTKIEGGCSSRANNYDNPSYESVWISNPLGSRKASGLINLFRTHPTTPDRIARLKALDEEINGVRHVL